MNVKLNSCKTKRKHHRKINMTLVYQTIVLITLISTCTLQDCPETCQCSGDSVTCRSSNETQLPSRFPSATRGVHIHYDLLAYINGSSFAESTSIGHLNINHGKLSYLSSSMFENLPMLTHMNLLLPIKEIHNGTFKGLPTIHAISISTSSLNIINEHSFSNENLQILSISGIQENDFFVVFKDLPKLRSLTIRSSYINRFHNNPFRHLQSLTTFAIQHNKAILDLSFLIFLTGLESLDLHDSDIKGNLSLQNFTKLSTLVLTFSDLTRVNIIDISPTVQNLYLRRANVPKDFWKHILNLDLNNINLEENDLSHWNGKEFNRFSNLTGLNLRSTKLQRFHLTNLTKLSYLNLDSNKDLAGKVHLAHLPSLHSLYMTGTSITDVRTAITSDELPSVRRLRLEYNKIHKLKNSTFKSFPNLQDLYLTNNNMHTIENHAFFNLTQLRDIRLHGNDLTNSLIPAENKKGFDLSKVLFKWIMVPFSLDITANKLEYVDDNVIPEMCRSFNVRHNLLRSITLTKNDSRLQHLYAEHNNYLSEVTISQQAVPYLKNFYLQGTRIHCTCSMKALSMRENLNIHGSCYEPHWLNGKTLKNLQHNNPCRNNGTCAFTKDGSYCNCTKGFHGKYCEIKNTPCSPEPCINGLCEQRNDSFFCRCKENYMGKFCTIRTFCFTNSCFNNATCIEKNNSFSCQCKLGFTGKQCEKEIKFVYIENETLKKEYIYIGSAGVATIFLILIVIICCQMCCKKSKKDLEKGGEVTKQTQPQQNLNLVIVNALKCEEESRTVKLEDAYDVVLDEGGYHDLDSIR